MNSVKPPYFAVIFSSLRASVGSDYAEMAERMMELASEQPGYLGIESARDEKGFGITVSYWASLEAISNWKQNAEHIAAQKKGKESWYKSYALKIARVEHAYSDDLDDEIGTRDISEEP